MKKINIILSLFALFFIFYSCSRITSNTTNAFDLETQLLSEGYVMTPLKMMSTGHVHFYSELNGIKGHFVLDTGAGVTVIEKKDKDKFNMQTIAFDGEATGAGGRGIKMEKSKNNTLQFDILTLDNLDLKLMSLDHVNNAFDEMGFEKINGVIGADILADYCAIIDYAKLKLYLKKE